MVTCRCGCEFENPREFSHVRCPRCGRIYANVSPNMHHPKTEEEYRWKCAKCGAENTPSFAGAPRRKCELCGADRPGNPGDWYGVRY